ncbi:MAG TPA: 50S ribosomal protein L24 [Verrucomicrobiae bacterium]|jgi:large subunit ribosomal protein L24|nr:50S ribosomal protein L24 [Verrucomicrobiae bacterium]
MSKFHVKKGDEVVVLAGAERGKRGKIIAVSPKKNRAIVEGLKMIKRHTRKSQDHPQGAIVEREGTIHLSNLMKVDQFDARTAKQGKAEPAPA